MKKFVCESLDSFLQLNEDIETAKEIFAQNDISTNSPVYQDFFRIFKDAKHIDQFANWITKGEVKLSPLKMAFKIEQELGKSIEGFQSFDEYVEAIENQKEKEIKKSEREPLVSEEPPKAEQRDPISFGKEEKENEFDDDAIVERLGLIPDPDKRGIYYTKEVWDNPDRKKVGQGVYIWTDVILLYKWKNSQNTNDLVTKFKFGQYGAHVKDKKTPDEVSDAVSKDPKLTQEDIEREIGKTAEETIASYSATFMGHKVILYVRNLNEELKDPKCVFKDAYEIEQEVRESLKSNGWHISTKAKSKEVYSGREKSLKDLIDTISNVVSGNTRLPLRTKIEQKEGIEKITKYFLSSPEHKEFLLAAKMRYGKNITVLRAIKELSDRDERYKNCLVITYKPSVFSSLRDDIKKFDDFSNFEIVDISKKSNIEQKSDKVRIFISSAQYLLYGGIDDEDLNESEDIKKIESEIYKLTPQEEVQIRQKTAYEDYEKNLDKIKNIHFGLIMADEYHYGTKSENFQKLLSRVQYDKIIYVSGTAMKDMATGKFEENQMYNWTYIDEQDSKKDGRNLDMPKMIFYKMKLSDKAKKLAISEDLYSEEEGFSFSKAIDVDKRGNLVSEPMMVALLEQLMDIKYGADSIVGAKNIVGNIRHMFWIFPKNVKGIKAVAKLMKRDDLKHLFEKYEIIPATGDLNSNIDNVKNKISEADSRNKGSITLSCYRFKEGTTVPQWGAVVMLDEGKSAEEYLQAIFRCQSPGAKGKEGEILKENCYVFDFNPQRLAVIYHDIAHWASKTGAEGQFEIINNFIKYAPILQSDKEGNQMVEMKAEDLVKEFRLYGSFSEKMANDNVFRYDEIIKLDKSRVEGILKELERISSERKSTKILLNDNELKKAKNKKGTKVEKPGKPGEDKNEEDIEEFENMDLNVLKEKIRNLLRAIPTYLFTTDTDETKLEMIYNLPPDNPNALLFKEICGVDTSFLKKLVDLKIISEKNINQTIQYFSEAITEVEKSDSLEDLEKFINHHLVMSGEEGSTPNSIVNEMLDKLPDEIWKDKTKTFCDPVCGTGKYLLSIKKRLMEGLEGQFSSKEEMEKHIIENQIWGYDIIKYKVLITSKLLTRNKKYDHNIEQKDSLKFLKGVIKDEEN